MTKLFGVNYGIKKFFIDDKRIHGRLEASRAKALRRFGTILRRYARSLIKKGKKQHLSVVFGPSQIVLYGAAAASALKTGSARVRSQFQNSGPPVWWTRQEPNLKTILYGFDGDTLICGPVGFGSSGGMTVPERLEYGRGGYRKRPWMNPALKEKEDELLNSLLKFGI